MASAERLNKRIGHGVEYYAERLRHYVGMAMQDGFVVGTEPQDPELEFQELSAQLPTLYAIAQNPELPAGYRARAQQGMLRWTQLWRRYGQPQTATQEASQES